MWVLRLILVGCSLCMIQVYGLNSMAQYSDFVEETNDVVRRVKANDITILFGYLNAYVGNKAGAWGCVSD